MGGLNVLGIFVGDLEYNGHYIINQMGYILLVILASLLGWPLKQALIWRKNNPTAKPTMFVYGQAIFYACLVIGNFVIVVTRVATASNHADAASYKDVFLVLSNFTTLLLAAFACMFGELSYLPWVMFLNIFTGVIFAPVGDVRLIEGVELNGHHFHSIMLFWLGMVMQITVWLRSRFYFIEATLMMIFLSGSFVVSDPLKMIPVLDKWALFAYVSHGFIIPLFGNQLGATSLYCLGFILFLGKLSPWSPFASAKAG